MTYTRPLSTSSHNPRILDLELTHDRKASRAPSRHCILATRRGLLAIRTGKLHQNRIELQSTSRAGAGGLEDPARLHRSRDGYCGFVYTIPFNQFKDEVDEFAVK